MDGAYPTYKLSGRGMFSVEQIYKNHRIDEDRANEIDLSWLAFMRANSLIPLKTYHHRLPSPPMFRPGSYHMDDIDRRVREVCHKYADREPFEAAF
jgi:hypothetical protein